MINLFFAGFSAGCAFLFFLDNRPYATIANLFACLLNFYIWYVGR